MVLDRIKTFLQTLPDKRGKEAVKAYGVVVVLLFLLGGGIALIYNFFLAPGGLQPGATTSSAVARTAEEARDIPGPINGVLFTASEAKAWQNRRPLAVVIENHRDARPQSGLSSADVVYEALAEGGITRYLAVYLTNLNTVGLGPIRSVRTYFLDWLQEYDAPVAHVGGNMDALDRIGPEKVKDLDQFFLGTSTYERTSDRAAPHNVYTNTDLLWKAAEKKGFTGASSIRSWKFKEEATASARPSAQVLKVGFLNDPSYKVTWAYSQEANTYLRSLGGKDDADRNNNQRIFAKTVLVQFVSYNTGVTRIGESTVILGTTGSGKAYVFTDGVVTEGTWSKTSRTDRTVFKTKDGVEIPFNRGPIWVEVVPASSPVDF